MMRVESVSRPPIVLVRRTPDVGERLAPGAAIELVFDRAMNPASAEGLSFVPALRGTTSWPDARTLRFDPVEPLPRDTAFVVGLDDRVRAADGGVLAEPLNLRFRTQGWLGVAQTIPADGTADIATDATITVLFDRPIVPLTVLANQARLPQPLRFEPPIAGTTEWLNTSALLFRPSAPLASGMDYTAIVAKNLTGVDGEPLQDEFRWKFTTSLPRVVSVSPQADGENRVRVDATVVVQFNQAISARKAATAFFLIDGDTVVPGRTAVTRDTLTFTPTKRLKHDAAYTARVAAGVTGVAGGRPTTQATEWDFRTVPLPALIAIEPADGSAGVSPDGSVTLVFNTDIDPATVMSHVRITPAISPTSTYTSYNSYDHRFVIAFDMRPATEYVVEVDAGVRDPYGNVTSEGMQASFRTGDRAATMRPYLRYGATMFDARRPVRVAVDAVNVDRIDVDVHRLDDTPANLAPRFIGDLPKGAPYLSLRKNPTTQRNELGRTIITLGKNETDPLPAGAYVIELSSPQLTGQSPYRYLIYVSDVNLVMKSEPDEVILWATDRSTGALVTGLDLEVYQRVGDVIQPFGAARTDAGLDLAAERRTDADGIVRIRRDAAARSPGYAEDTFALARGPRFAIVSTQWGGSSDWFDFGGVMGDVESGLLRTHLYTDRAIYRSGQKVYWRGVARMQDDFRYDLPVDAKVQATLRDANGNTIYTRDVLLDAFGAFSDVVDLPADAAPGTYYLDARIDDARGVNLGGASSTFDVAAYRPPEFEATVVPASAEIRRDDALRAVVNAAYLSGGALPDAPLAWNVVARAYDFAPAGFDRYSFRDADDPWRCYDCWWFRPDESTTPIASGEGRTNAKGAFALEVPLPSEIRDATGALISGPLALSVEANVTGADDQVLAGRAAVVAHPADVYVGVATSLRIVSAGEKVRAEFVTVDWQGNRVASRDVKITVVRRSFEQPDVEVAAFEVTTDPSGAAQVEFDVPSGGVYKIVAAVRDEAGRAVRASTFFWATGPNAVLWPDENNIKIDLISDKSTYEPGETARILIPSPFIDADHAVHYALVTVERGHVLRHEVVKITSGSTVYELPIDDAYAPNIYVSVVLLNAPKAGTDEFAQQRTGMVGLRVSARKRMMQLSLAPDRANAQPGEAVGITLRATDAEGRPVVGAFSFDLVDKGILNLKPRREDAIVHAFYDPIGNRVRTASGLYISGARVLEANELYYPDVRIRSAADEIPMAEAPEAGAPPDAAAPAGPTVRENFADTAYWRADVVTDRDGRARIEVTLPDNLTTWVLRAVGVDAETRVGEALTNVVTSLPLMIRPVTPRFFVVDDVVVLGAIVQNATTETLAVQAGLQAAGVSIDGPAVTTVTVPAASEVLVKWKVRVLDAPQADLVFRATSGEYADAAKPRLATAPNGGLRIERYLAPETVGTAGELSGEDARSEVVVLPKEADAERSVLDLRLNASLAGAMREGLDYVEHYPYECVEQIVSRFLPNVLTYRALDQLGIEDPELAQRLPSLVATGVKKLQRFQNFDGGWGWWPYRRSAPHVSAWAVYGLLQARDAGFEVPTDVLQRGLDYLATQQQALGLNSDKWTLNWHAWLQYVLAEAGRSDEQRIAELFELRTKMSHYGRALLILAMGRRDPQDERIRALFSDLNTKAVLSATGAHWEESDVDWWAMNTDVRTTALVLTALARFDPQNDLAPNVVRWLMQARTAGNGYWRTTQETSWSLIALTDWMRATGELAANYGYRVRVGDGVVSRGTMNAANITRTVVITAPGAQLASDAATRVSLIKGVGAGKLYYTAHLKAMLPASAVRAADRGIVVQRRYVRADCTAGPRCPSVTNAKVGDVLRVELTIVAPSDLTYLQLEDPLPAGAEAIDARLATSSQLDREPALGESGERRWWWFWNWWSHSEIRDDRVSLFADWLARGTYTYSYTMRITSAGQFQVRPSYASLQYFPEVFGRSDGMLFKSER
jgi:uncharacterized protein YfaS (alpha-2-macroglobulin family)